MLTFEDLYETYAPDVYRFAHWLTGDSQKAEDITSETFIRAWVRIHTLRTETLKAYLFAITRNIYLEQLRKGKNRDTLYDVHPDSTPSPDNVVEARLDIIRVQHFLQTLPEIDRAAFVMRVQHQLPCVEIARILGLSLTATKVKIHRVRKKLLANFVE